MAFISEDAPGVERPGSPGMAYDFSRPPLCIGAEVRLELRLPIGDVAESQLGLPCNFILCCDWPAFEALDGLGERAPAKVRSIVAVEEPREGLRPF